MSVSRTYARARTRRRPILVFRPWMVAVAAGLLLSAAALSFPGVRSAVGSAGRSVARQVKQDFGLPETDGRVLVCRLLDDSGSSREAKTQILAQLPEVGHVPTVMAQTYIWRYSAREELVYAGVNLDRFMVPALNDYYKNVPLSRTRGTYLAKAMTAAERVIDKWHAAHPGGVVVMTIGTDGGAEDAPQVRAVARRLAEKNVLCLVHGVLVQQRLREQISYALQPLDERHHLFVCNRRDFAQTVQRLGKATDAAMRAVKPLRTAHR